MIDHCKSCVSNECAHCFARELSPPTKYREVEHMTWNHRLVKLDDELIGLYEVYYDDHGNPMYRTEKPCGIWLDVEEGRGDHIQTLQSINRAFELPVLDDVVFNPADLSAQIDDQDWF